MHSESLPRLKAPRDDGAVLAYPPLDDAGALLVANAQRLASSALQLQGRALADLRALARREVVAAARAYLHEAGEPVPEFPGEQWLLAGHQPELFHPGVWLKNFALQGLARQHRAVPLNLIVDNDIAKPAVLRLPHETQRAQVSFDTGRAEVPYEERTVEDEQMFASLLARVEPMVRDWPFRPLLSAFWTEALKQRRRTPLLGERLAAARRSLERAWGATPLEVPLSRVCQTEAFAWFAVHVLRALPRFHADYNGAVQAYRHRHEMRSPLHPAPDLTKEGDWLETPFWVWRTGAPRRQRLWALGHRDAIELRAGRDVMPALRGDALVQVAQWRLLASAAFKVRTRALTTTLFARLLLGDLFIHGIGGGKYDEVTDDLFRKFFDLDPPRFLILTATLLLPLQRFPDAAAEYERLRRLQRDLHWNPQRHLEGAAHAAQAFVHEKQTWIARTCANHDERSKRFLQLRHLSEQLQAFTQSVQESVRQRYAVAEQHRRLHAVRSSREYAFCLYPEEMLRDFYQQFH